jgi:hypothetical protein
VSCPLCGDEHENLGRFVAWNCPRVPLGCVYVDEEFESGPPGRLFTVKEFQRKRRELTDDS